MIKLNKNFAGLNSRTIVPIIRKSIEVENLELDNLEDSILKDVKNSPKNIPS